MKKTLFVLSLGLGTMLNAQSPFPAVDQNFYDTSSYAEDLDEVVIPASPIKYDVIFTGGVDYVYNADGDSALAKEWQDFTGYVPINERSDSGYVIVNHERVEADPINGDGGGMTVFTVWYNQDTKTWERTSNYRNVDFSGVGGTAANCGGIQTSWGKVFTAEEWGSSFKSNQVLAAQGLTDTSDYTIATCNGETVNETIKRNQNFQYMVEVDVANAVAVRKNYNMGRYDHEGGWIASDKKTVYLTDDNSGGSVLFRFVADEPEDFSKGQLYCYKQSDDGMSGTWEMLDMNLETMLDARNAAYAKGATVFMRLEWIVGINDETVFITETGRGKAQSVKSPLEKGATLASHLRTLDAMDGSVDSTFTDMWGRLLRLNTTTGKIESALEGGGDINRTYQATGNHLSSPDGLTSTVIEGKTYLAINEDMNPGGIPSTPAHFASVLNEVYLLNVSDDAPGKHYSVSDLTRFIAGPAGCETTGGRFTPDGTTFFVNIQHPSTENVYPFNHSVTLAITGYADILDGSDVSTEAGSLMIEPNQGFGMRPNPASRVLYLNKNMDVAIYNVKGQRLLVERNTSEVNINSLVPGTYIIKNGEGATNTLLVK